MTRWLTVWLALCGCFHFLDHYGSAASAVAPTWRQSGQTVRGAELETRIANWIEQLGADDYHARSKARWELGRIGLPAFSQLREAIHHPNIQIASAARYLVKSQNVVWWLETDSTEVRRLLMDYNSLNEVERDTRLQRLGRSGSQDALLALCRLARFESNENLSKSAALYLMENIADSEPDSNLPRSILVTIEQDDRRATQWLRAITTELLESATKASVWKEFAADEALDAAKVMKASEGRRPLADSNAGALRFNNWVGKWLTQRVDRAQALDAVKPSMDLVAPSDYACLEYTNWALDAQLPELVIELAQKHLAIFEHEPHLGYLLAECHLRCGDAEAAEAAAKQASQQIQTLVEKMIPIAANIHLNDMVADRRTQIADKMLVKRGRFDWAEKEFMLAIELGPSLRSEAEARSTCAEFYWSGGEYQKAADILRPMFIQSESTAESGLPGRAPALGLVAPDFYFYDGLAATERGDYELASELFIKALQVGEPSPAYSNPDIVIAMKQIANNEVRKQIFEEHFEQMVQDFRAEVITSEKVLAESPDRRTRDYLSSQLANQCNQLAWLLSRCEVGGEEAVNLGRRALEFYPDDPAYLDTLGRCYFTAGQIEEAIKYQERAVVASPHDRQMKAQLAEFQSALAGKKIASPETTDDKP